MVRGLDTFAAFFAGDEAHYVLIGGVATQLVLEEAGLPVRATKDLDIVLCVEALDAAFGEKLWAFIRAGGYEVRQEGIEGRRFYRFAKPADPAYPSMLEFFAREPGHLPLAADAHLTPVPFDQQVESLSAILLDQDYYDFLHAHTRQLAGVRIVTEPALIGLKARAWLDLTARKAADSEAVDSRHIGKHRSDVLRLSQLLSPDERIEVAEAIRADIASFCRQVVTDISPQLLGQLEIAEAPDALIERVRRYFGVQA
ncbi:nucleotidyl transferase AbiEii/AbiGii toxin family protein [Stenotrophomonas sp. STM01]|uniref:nucleotidyl transferase AbiEii/AbiGii toxin family protein n=1 Tax=Stenotrophomonas sp. STM01 TaxID=2769278 RepID=UPI00177C6202|nr:nucleotidyl transferase AbiEii/AbiGii toxin family protein [Stenotrophomonas sp. STM01]MBD9537152.1 nucleotidyl transferase AbiEii/AbiGii toxin family protein [Stenotrophomonas sp. STM01]